MINPGVVAAIHAAGERGDPCGAMQRIAPQESPRTPTAGIAATTPRLTVRILNSVFLKTFKIVINDFNTFLIYNFYKVNVSAF